jgi:hypothetical protein
MFIFRRFVFRLGECLEKTYPPHPWWKWQKIFFSDKLRVSEFWAWTIKLICHALVNELEKRHSTSLTNLSLIKYQFNSIILTSVHYIVILDNTKEQEQVTIPPIWKLILGNILNYKTTEPWQKPRTYGLRRDRKFSYLLQVFYRILP